MVDIFNSSLPQTFPRFHEFPEIKPSALKMSTWQWIADGHQTVHTWASDTVSHIPRWLLYSGLTVGVGLATTVGYFYNKPGECYSLMTSVRVWRAGYKVKCVDGVKYRYSYMERGSPSSTQPSLLFINGFGGSKEDWTPLVKVLPWNIHVICVDLPSQGSTTVPTDMADASLYKLADYLHEFVELLKMNKKQFHIVGISMGGGIAGIYSARYPEHVDRLTLVCPALKCPIVTEMWHHDNFDENNPDPDVAAYRDLIKKCVYNKSLMPDALWIYKMLLDLNKAKAPFKQLLGKNLKSEICDEEFDQTLSRISVPVQIIWGEEDQLIHVSGASKLEELIDSVKRTDILPRCGHVVFLDQMDPSKSLLLDFYNTTYSS